MTFIHSNSGLHLEGKTLIVPVVSTANVAQLAVDLLIATLSLVRVAVLDSRYCVPVVGAREDDLNGITTPIELYGRSDLDFLVIQQRSPILKSRKQEFIDIFLGFIKTSKIGAVLLISGVDPLNRTDAQMMTTTYQFRPKNSRISSTALQSLESLPIPAYTSPVRQEPQNLEESNNIPFIPGGGLTRRILNSLPDGWSVPTACLLQFVFEGDNQTDANILASIVAKVIGVDDSCLSWKQPSSWREGLFGAPHDQSLYG